MNIRIDTYDGIDSDHPVLDSLRDSAESAGEKLDANRAVISVHESVVEVVYFGVEGMTFVGKALDEFPESFDVAWVSEDTLTVERQA